LNVTREDLPGRQVALTIDLDPETINQALDKAYRQMVNQYNVPGFRRGKAPRYILESYLGKEALTERAVNNMLPETVQEALKDQDLEALDVSDVEIVSMDPVQVKVTVVQPPLVELGDYGSIRVEKETAEVTPEQVDEVLHELRRDGAPWNEPAEARPAAEGDMAYVDLEGFTTQGPLEEAKRENFPTIIGLSRAGVPEAVNKELVGMSVGDEKDVTDALPDDYPNEELRGLDVTYHVTLRSIKEQQLPELDDEFAKKAGYDTVEALREAVDRNLRQRTEEAAETKQLDAVIEQLVEGSNIDVPDVLVNEELDSMLKNLEERVKQQFNIPLRRFLTLNGLTEEQWREGEREHARGRVLRTQALQEFARREGIGVDEGEIDTEVTQVLERFEEDQREEVAKAFDQHQMRHDLEDRIFQRKIVDRLTAIAEGRAEATPAEAKAEATPKASRASKKGKAAASEDESQGDAADLAEAGGAAELLGTAGVDVESANETGDAPAGGTPTTAPGLAEK
jgi:trigger factor